MKLLEQMGADLVSLANNHVYDYGPEAMLDTTDLLDEAGIAYVGGGRNIDEAERPAYFIVNGMKIGFVAASNAEKTKYTPAATEDSPGILEAYDTTEFNRVISQASEECDYLIAYIHWDRKMRRSIRRSRPRRGPDSWSRELISWSAGILMCLRESDT